MKTIGRIIRLIGLAFTGFVVMLVAGHFAMVVAAAASMSIFGSSSPSTKPATWILGVGVVPLVLAAAAALPAIGLDQSLKRSLIIGYVGGLLAVVVFIVVSPYYPDYWLFSPDDALASITPVGVSVLAASLTLKPAADAAAPTRFSSRWYRFALLLILLTIFVVSILIAAPASQTVGFLLVLLTWLILPVAAHLLAHL